MKNRSKSGGQIESDYRREVQLHYTTERMLCQVPTYRVLIREVHIQGMLIEAEDEEAAIFAVRYGDGELDEAHFEYSHTMRTDTWTVELEED